MDEPTRSEEITDALIRRGLIRTDGGVICPDTSFLAGLHEGSLEPDETERWMTHLAGCRRCQETLAALARVEAAAPPAHAPAGSWWAQVQRGLRWPVLAPLAAGAVIVLAVWVTDPGSPVDRQRATPEGSANVAARSAAAPTGPPIPEPTSESNDRTIGESERFAQVEDADATTEAEPTATLALDLQTVTPSAEARETASTQPEESADAVARPLRPQVLASARAGARPADAAALLGAAEPSDPVADPVVLSSPQDRRRWRAGLDGNIARTDDDGQTWRVQLNVSERVRAGAAPSIEVAWLVGDRGLVLRTLDGERWVRTSVPVAASLAGIEASNELRATVTTADGRRFQTVDGGAGWTLVP